MNYGHRIIAVLLILPVVAFLGAWWYCYTQKRSPEYSFSQQSSLYLTDLALFCEAPQTRHPLLSDLQTAYREGPGAQEHSISSLFMPPPLPPEQAEKQ